MDPAVGQGMVSGGWGYVAAVYGISWAIFLFYSLNLVLRARRER